MTSRPREGSSPARGLRTVHLTIPWLALTSSNERNSRRGGKAHSKAYKTNRAAVAAITGVALKGHTPAFPAGEVTMRVRFYPPDYRRRDCDNLLKCLVDGMNTLAFKDDAQIRDLSWLRVDVDEDNPRAEIDITGEAAA